MIFFILGALFFLFLLAAAVGTVVGLAIGVVRFVRNPMTLVTDIKGYFVKRYGR